MNHMALALLVGGTLVLFSGCSSSGNGGRAGVPDEFRVVKKAPLTVPPEYSLRPPERGVVRPAEVTNENQDRIIAFGSEIGQDASPVELMLITRAGAIAVSPVIRDVIDYDESGILRKSRTVSDIITGYTGSEEELALIAEDNATGGEKVTIERGTGKRIKLPGT